MLLWLELASIASPLSSKASPQLQLADGLKGALAPVTLTSAEVWSGHRRTGTEKPFAGLNIHRDYSLLTDGRSNPFANEEVRWSALYNEDIQVKCTEWSWCETTQPNAYEPDYLVKTSIVTINIIIIAHS